MRVSSSARVVALILIGLGLTSCSAFMATQQPDRKNLAVLSEATPRQEVRAELGMPIQNGKDVDGFDFDIFEFIQGYSKGSKAARAAWHGLADVFTLGLWEVVGMPVEALASGTKLKVTVTYDEQQKVKMVKLQDEAGNEFPLKKKSG